MPATLSARASLMAIARAHPGRLFNAFLLLLLENALLLAYPLLAGLAIDAIVRGDAGTALWYAVAVLGMWLLGALRRAVDTRSFTRIYADIAVPVVLEQRLINASSSATAARVVLAREFVDFFEKQVPLLLTALVSMLGSVIMLMFLEFKVGAFCMLALVLCLALGSRFMVVSQSLHERINDAMEREVGLLFRVGAQSLRRHYGLLSRLRVRLSDREAAAYAFLGGLIALLFLLTILELAGGAQVTAGHVYAVMTYLWSFVSSLDELPGMVDQLARLRDIGGRVAGIAGREPAPAR